MPWREVLDLYDLLDDASASGEAVAAWLRKNGVADVQVTTVTGDKGSTDFVRAVQASAELGSWTLLAQTITEWQGTAVIHADPELRASLVDPVPEGDDFGSVPSPAGR